TRVAPRSSYGRRVCAVCDNGDMAKESGRTMIAQNRKARYDYHIEDTFEAGLVLTGTEVKSLRAGRASLVDGFGDVDDGELWLLGVHIPEYTQGTWTNHSARRKRKLLLHRSEIDKIAAGPGWRHGPRGPSPWPPVSGGYSAYTSPSTPKARGRTTPPAANASCCCIARRSTRSRRGSTNVA